MCSSVISEWRRLPSFPDAFVLDHGVRRSELQQEFVEL
jgi:hypothetical protein